MGKKSLMSCHVIPYQVKSSQQNQVKSSQQNRVEVNQIKLNQVKSIANRSKEKRSHWAMYHIISYHVISYHIVSSRVKSSQVRSLQAREYKAISTWYMLVNPIELKGSEIGKKSFKSSQVIPYHTILHQVKSSRVRSCQAREHKAISTQYVLVKQIELKGSELGKKSFKSSQVKPYHTIPCQENSIQ